MRVILLLMMLPFAMASPVIDSAVVEGDTVILSGSGFGEKQSAAPFRSSWNSPVAGMNFQKTGVLDSSWFVTGQTMVSVVDNMSRVPGRKYIRLEYSSRGNWGGTGYSAGLNTNLPMTKIDYWSWWDHIPLDFNASHMNTGSANFKYMYASPGLHPHKSLQVCEDGKRIMAAAGGGLAGDTEAEQNANLDLPFGGYFYARPMSWRATYELPKGRWFFVEWMMKMNTASGIKDGWTELRIDNQRIYKATNADIYDGVDDAVDFRNLRFGGNYAFDASGEEFHRFYGDIYIDGTFQRIAVCEKEEFDECRHVEIQVPGSWSDTQIGFQPDLGTLSNTTDLFIYVLDKDNQASNPIRLPRNDCLLFSELIDCIGRWHNGSMSIAQLMNAIGRWKACG
jgi:hypothetical protein